MIKELIKLSDHLDRKGYSQESDYLDAIIKMASEEGLEESNGDSQDEEGPRPSKWHKMKMMRVVDEMDKNDFKTLSFEIGNYTVRVNRKHEEDCD